MCINWLRVLGWCPSIACIKEQRSDVDRSLVELGVKVAWHARAQQELHGPRRVRHTCQHSWAIQPLTGMRLRESNDPRLGRTSREAISALRPTDRRPPSPDDWNRWRTLEVDRVPCLGRVTASMHALYVFHTRYRGTPPKGEAAQESTLISALTPEGGNMQGVGGESAFYPHVIATCTGRNNPPALLLGGP